MIKSQLDDSIIAQWYEKGGVCAKGYFYYMKYMPELFTDYIYIHDAYFNYQTILNREE